MDETDSRRRPNLYRVSMEAVADRAEGWEVFVLAKTMGDAVEAALEQNPICADASVNAREMYFINQA